MPAGIGREALPPVPPWHTLPLWVPGVSCFWVPVLDSAAGAQETLRGLHQAPSSAHSFSPTPEEVTQVEATI